MNEKAAFPTLERGELGLDLEDAGMNLRDYFAAKAMMILLAQVDSPPDETWMVGVGLDAYAMADAMLEAREVKR